LAVSNWAKAGTEAAASAPRRKRIRCFMVTSENDLLDKTRYAKVTRVRRDL
jgi:hypothetical protein